MKFPGVTLPLVVPGDRPRLGHINEDITRVKAGLGSPVHDLYMSHVVRPALNKILTLYDQDAEFL
jgi:hypothetical protein